MPPRKKKEPEPETRDERTVTVPMGDSPSDTATLLLAAAEEAEVDPGVIRASSGVFYAPAWIAKKAGVEVQKDDEE
jgi:hypothetical protein